MSKTERNGRIGLDQDTIRLLYFVHMSRNTKLTFNLFSLYHMQDWVRQQYL